MIADVASYNIYQLFVNARERGGGFISDRGSVRRRATEPDIISNAHRCLEFQIFSLLSLNARKSDFFFLEKISEKNFDKPLTSMLMFAIMPGYISAEVRKILNEPHHINVDEYVRRVAHGKRPLTAFIETFSESFPEVFGALTNKDLQKAHLFFYTQKPVRKRIEEIKKDVAKKTKIDAAWVLKQAEMLFNKCIADDDNVTAKNTLDLIAKHRFVDAFASKKIDMTSQGKPMNISFDITFANPTQAEIEAADLSKATEPRTIEHEDTQALEHQNEEPGLYEVQLSPEQEADLEPIPASPG